MLTMAMLTLALAHAYLGHPYFSHAYLGQVIQAERGGFVQFLLDFRRGGVFAAFGGF